MRCSSLSKERQQPTSVRATQKCFGQNVGLTHESNLYVSLAKSQIPLKAAFVRTQGNQQRRKGAKKKEQTNFSRNDRNKFYLSRSVKTWGVLSDEVFLGFLVAVADRRQRQRQSLRGHLLADAGEAGVRLGRAELRDQLWTAEGALQG